MDTQTIIWIFGVMTAAVGFLYWDRDRTGKRIHTMETSVTLMSLKLDMLLDGQKVTNVRLDLFLKNEIDVLKDLAK